MDAKHVLVTGASKGIGRAICERLVADGYRVTGVARTRPAELPQGMAFHSLDLADNQAVAQFLAEQLQEQSFYGLVNNVGLVHSGALETVNSQDLYQAVQLNIEVAIRFTQALAPAMKAQKQGRVLNIASRAALGKQDRTIYSMTKAGMIGMTRTWALELARHGVTVNAIAARYGLRANHLSEWRGRARDGKLVLPAVDDDGFCFAPLVLSGGPAVPVPAHPGRPCRSEAQPLGPIEIAVGQVTIRLDGATTATRVAEIVRAIGASS